MSWYLKKCEKNIYVLPFETQNSVSPKGINFDTGATLAFVTLDPMENVSSCFTGTLAPT